jgi:hypothetical protein
MRTSATFLIVAALLGAAVAACAGPSRQFSAVMRGSDEAPPLPVVLSDETGFVTGFESAPIDPSADYRELAAQADPTNPNAFIVSWLGGACDNDAALTFKRGQGIYVLNVAVHNSIGLFGGCVALGVPREVRIVTSNPIPIDSIVAAGHT